MCASALATDAHAQSQDKAVQRAEQATQSQQQNSAPVSGTRFLFKPYIETEGGYDSNPDNLFSMDGSGFVKVEGGLKMSAETPSDYYGLVIKGRLIEYPDLDEDIQRRTDLKVAFDTSYDLSATETLRTSSYFLRDLISLARADIYHSNLEYALRQQNYRIKLSAKSHVEHNFDDESQGNDDFDDFSVSRAKAFDFARNDAQVSVLTFTQHWLQPFAIYDFGNIDYYNQVSGVSIDRDAREHYAIAGFRIQPNRNFRVDIGARYNDRDIDDQNFTHSRNGYLDINLFWQPADSVKITGVVERHFDEPGTSFGIVDDVQTYGLTLDWDVAAKWRLTGTAYYDREDALGDEVLYKKYTTTMALTYEPSDNIEVFLSGLAKWVEEDVTGDTYERFKIGAGTRFKF